MLLLSVVGIGFRCIYCLLHMLNGVMYTEAEIQSTVLHLIQLLSRQFHENSPKITNKLFVNGYFNLTSDTFSENKFDEAGGIRLNMKRNFKQSTLSWHLSKV